ncbi:class I SAM-dependent methyltransferase [Paenibacillus piri]|uniref:Methyltransferase domain-containing protein n=1 Tax=Paenibacillus piri TaxID=2547395 RepID=A0A4V2ZSQ8_9BACL|nr:methyltransferase [Paenibacillus piri]TDF94194.1 methyltransferase domain-containing protein [Paenibacillus piri]
MANISTLVQEKFIFLHTFIRSPKAVGSITPSSKFLAQALTKSIPWDSIGAVAELGSGTGPVTKQIKLAAKPHNRIILFEKDPVLREQLSVRYPEYACYPDACQIRSAASAEGVGQLDAIVSGLPFFNFPEQLRKQLMDEIAAALKPGGLFIAFQYSLQMKQLLSRYFHIEDIRLVPINLPPAFVYVCRKKEQHP